MAGEEIKFTITPKGITFESTGFTGGSCLTALESFRDYMKSIGVVINDTHQEIKPEMYNTEQTEMKNEY